MKGRTLSILSTKRLGTLMNSRLLQRWKKYIYGMIELNLLEKRLKNASIAIW
jgi:hypothetical protein